MHPKTRISTIRNNNKNKPNKLKILVISNTKNITKEPSLFVRILDPYELIKNDKRLSYKVTSDESVTSKDILDNDIIIFLRSASIISNLIMFIAKRCNKFSIYDIDDHFLEMPGYSTSQQIKKATKRIEYNIKNANLVTVSTDKIKSRLTRLNKNIKIIENSFNIHKYNQEKSKQETNNAKKNKIEKKNDKIRIVISNSDNLKLTKTREDFYKAVGMILEEFNDNIELHIFGPELERLNNKRYKNVFHFGLIRYDKHKEILARGNYDIALVPIEREKNTTDYKFDICKSNIKYIEYGYLKIAGIYSDMEIYSKHIKNGANGILVDNSKKQWYEAIKNMIKNKEMRENIKNNAYKDVKKRYTIEKMASAWKEILIEDRELTCTKLRILYLKIFWVIIYSCMALKKLLRRVDK